MPLTVPESRVLALWRSAIQRRVDLVTEDNEPVRIIYPGRPNDDRGADLRDAVIATRRGLFKGDIEIHVKSTGWRSHRHHEDPAYNRVILHVVYRQDTGGAPALQHGGEAPTLALHHYAEEQAGRRITSVFSPVVPAACRADPASVGGLLDKAGEARFLAGVAHFQEEALPAGHGQALYRGIMTALGYSKNKEAMAGLAGHMPLRELENISSGTGPDDSCLAQLQAVLLGTAGLLPAPRRLRCPPGTPAGEYARELERCWEKSGGTAQMAAGDWRFFRVRPGNFPVRRIVAMSGLLCRYRQQGILNGLKSALEGTAADGGRSLEESLSVGADGYWGRYLDFALRVRGTAPALLGRERAAEIIVNVLLPFYAAYARASSQPLLGEKAVAIFNRYRAPAENSLEKHMRRQLGLPPDTVATARRRQGLIHIYKTLCTQGKCGVCPLHA